MSYTEEDYIIAASLLSLALPKEQQFIISYIILNNINKDYRWTNEKLMVLETMAGKCGLKETSQSLCNSISKFTHRMNILK